MPNKNIDEEIKKNLASISELKPSFNLKDEVFTISINTEDISYKISEIINTEKSRNKELYNFLRHHLKEMNEDKIAEFELLRHINKTLRDTARHVRSIDYIVAVCAGVYIIETLKNWL